MSAHSSLSLSVLALVGLVVWVVWARRVSRRWVGPVMRPELGPGSVVEVRRGVEVAAAQRGGRSACRG